MPPINVFSATKLAILFFIRVSFGIQWLSIIVCVERNAKRGFYSFLGDCFCSELSLTFEIDIFPSPSKTALHNWHKRIAQFESNVMGVARFHFMDVCLFKLLPLNSFHQKWQCAYSQEALNLFVCISCARMPECPEGEYVFLELDVQRDHRQSFNHYNAN